jgi:hypothetical protein
MLKYAIWIFFVGACASSHAGLCKREDQLSFLKNEGIDIGSQLSVEQVEREHMFPVTRDGKTVALPFGYAHSDWLELKAKWKKGDRFVEVKSSGRLVERTKFYLDGHALVRGNCVVGFIKGRVS